MFKTIQENVRSISKNLTATDKKFHYNNEPIVAELVNQEQITVYIVVCIDMTMKQNVSKMIHQASFKSLKNAQNMIEQFCNKCYNCSASFSDECSALAEHDSNVSFTIVKTLLF